MFTVTSTHYCVFNSDLPTKSTYFLNPFCPHTLSWTHLFSIRKLTKKWAMTWFTSLVFSSPSGTNPMFPHLLVHTPNVPMLLVHIPSIPHTSLFTSLVFPIPPFHVPSVPHTSLFTSLLFPTHHSSYSPYTVMQYSLMRKKSYFFMTLILTPTNITKHGKI